MQEGVRSLIEWSLINMPDAALRRAGQTEAFIKKCDVYAHKFEAALQPAILQVYTMQQGLQSLVRIS